MEPILRSALVTASMLIGLSAGTASALDLPPRVTLVANSAFDAPQSNAAQAMTFVLDLVPDAAFPRHSHPGPSSVLIMSGELTETDAAGKDIVYRAGQQFLEDVGRVHSVRNTGKETARLVWTILLPKNGELIIPQAQ